MNDFLVFEELDSPELGGFCEASPKKGQSCLTLCLFRRACWKCKILGCTLELRHQEVHFKGNSCVLWRSLVKFTAVRTWSASHVYITCLPLQAFEFVTLIWRVI